MTAPFDFKAWQALTGWSAPQIAERTGLSLSLIEKIAAGRVPVSTRAAILFHDATDQLVAALQDYTGPTRRVEVPAIPPEPPPAPSPVAGVHAAQAKVQNIAGLRLRMFVERIERLEKELGGLQRRNPALAAAYARERATLQEDVKAVYAEAKGTGFDPVVLKEVIRIRKMVEEQRWMLPLYLEALES